MFETSGLYCKEMRARWEALRTKLASMEPPYGGSVEVKFYVEDMLRTSPSSDEAAKKSLAINEARDALLKVCHGEDFRQMNPHLKQLIDLRHEFARLHGVDSFSDYKEESFMVKSPEKREKFLTDMMNALSSFRDEHLDRFSDMPDMPSVSDFKKMVADSNVIDFHDQTAVRGYFPVSHVVSEMLDIFGNLFDVRFEKSSSACWPNLDDPWVDGSCDPNWNSEGVQSYRVWERNKFVGFLYFDLFGDDGSTGHNKRIYEKNDFSSNKTY